MCIHVCVHEWEKDVHVSKHASVHVSYRIIIPLRHSLYCFSFLFLLFSKLCVYVCLVIAYVLHLFKCDMCVHVLKLSVAWWSHTSNCACRLTASVEQLEQKVEDLYKKLEESNKSKDNNASIKIQQEKRRTASLASLNESHCDNR